MKEHPIIMTGHSVRALLAGTKTQTRRTVTWQGPKHHPHFFGRAFTDNPAGVRRLCVPHHHPEDRDAGRDERGDLNPCHRHYPRWEKGDMLWVRETWGFDRTIRHDFRPIARHDLSGRDLLTAVKYAADGKADVPRWRPSIFMSRWASRLTLVVTEEPIPQRLQDISEEDARAEGLFAWTSPRGLVHYGAGLPDVWETDPRLTYARLWDAINGKRARWKSNPWVWRIAFLRLP